MGTDMIRHWCCLGWRLLEFCHPSWAESWQHQANSPPHLHLQHNTAVLGSWPTIILPFGFYRCGSDTTLCTPQTLGVQVKLPEWPLWNPCISAWCGKWAQVHSYRAPWGGWAAKTSQDSILTASEEIIPQTSLASLENFSLLNIPRFLCLSFSLL